MYQENLPSPTFLKQIPYKARAIFSPIPQTQQIVPQFTYISASPQKIQEIRSSNYANFVQEKVKPKPQISEEKDAETQRKLVEILKAENKALQKQLSSLLQGDFKEDSEFFASLGEKDAIFQRKEQIFEEERAQLLQKFEEKEKLWTEKLEEMQKQWTFQAENLQKTIEDGEMRAKELENLLEDARNQQNEEKQEIFEGFEAQKRDLETKINRVLEENDKVLALNRGLIQENETLRALNQSKDQNHQVYAEELRISLKAQLEASKSSQKSAFEQERILLENQIRDLKAFSDNLKENLSKIFKENQDLRQEKDAISEESEARVREIEEKIATILTKNQELLALLEMNREETATFQAEVRELEAENRDFLEKLQQEHEKVAAFAKREAQLLKEIESSSTNKEKLEALLRDLEHKVLDLLADNEKLNGALLERIKENEALKVANTSNKLLNEKNEELLEALEKNAGKLRELQEKFEKLLEENRKLNAGFEKTHRELETAKARVCVLENELEAKLKIINDHTSFSRAASFQSSKEKESLINSINSLEKTNHEMRDLIETLNSYKNSLETELSSQKAAFSSLEDEISELRDEISSEKANNQALLSENRDKELEIQLLREKIETLDANFAVQSQEIKLSYEAAMQYLQAEIELHKQSLVQAHSTIEDCGRAYRQIREKFEESAKTAQNLEETRAVSLEIDRLSREKAAVSQEIQNFRQENAALRANLQEIELVSRENEQKAAHFRGKFEETAEKLVEVSRERAEIATKLEESLRKSEDFRAQLRDLLSANAQLQEKIKDLAFEHQECFDSREQLLENQRKKAENCDLRVQELENSLISLQNQLQKDRRDRDLLRNRAEELEIALRSCESRAKAEKDAQSREKLAISREKDEIFASLCELQQEFARIREINASLREALRDNQREINELKTENERIFNEKERILKEFDRKYAGFVEKTQDYHAALKEMENVCYMKDKDSAHLVKENADLRRFHEETQGKFATFKENLPVFEEIPWKNGRIPPFATIQAEIPGKFAKNTGFERKTLGILENNDRLNEQILRRCREILGE